MPRKYNTEEERVAAKREQTRLRMAKKRAAAREEAVAAPAPPAAQELTFIAYAPTPSDVPTITPLNLGLRSDLVGIPRPISPPQTQSQGRRDATPQQSTPRRPPPQVLTPRQPTPQSSMPQQPVPQTPSPQKLRRPTPRAGSTPRMPLHASRDLTISVSPLHIAPTPLALQPPSFFLHEEEDEVIQEQEDIRWKEAQAILDEPDKVPVYTQPIPSVEEDVLDDDFLNPLEEALEDLEISEEGDTSDVEEVAPEMDMVGDKRGIQIVNHLARQLRWFKGCSRGAHANERYRHRQRHKTDMELHPDCNSLEVITDMIKGTFNNQPALPDVLGSKKMMAASSEPPDANLAMILEGVPFLANEPPRSLYLDIKHIDRAGGVPNTSFDIDSTVCFPSSLAVAKEGIFMYETFNENQNFKKSIHFSTPALELDGNNRRTTASVPLHLVPHYCLGTVRGADDMVMHVFFPHLRASNYPVDNNRLSNEDLDVWFEQILLPAREKAIGDANYLAHLTPSLRSAKFNATASSKETMARKETAAKQRVGVHIQPRYLEDMWKYVLETIQNGIEEHNECERFAKPLLLLSSKNTKLNHMVTANATLPLAYESWLVKWQRTTDPRFYKAESTFVDLAKQTTAASSTTPYGVYDTPDPEVYLWRGCCLKTYLKSRRKECHRPRDGELPP